MDAPSTTPSTRPMEQIGREVAVALKNAGALGVDINPLPNGGVRVVPVQDSYVTAADVAKMLSVSVATVCRWAESGKLTHIRGDGKKAMYRFNLRQLRRDLKRLSRGVNARV